MQNNVMEGSSWALALLQFAVRGCATSEMHAHNAHVVEVSALRSWLEESEPGSAAAAGKQKKVTVQQLYIVYIA